MTKHSKIFAWLTGTTAIALAGMVWAAPGGPKGPVSIADVEAKAQARFEALDTSGDGVISLAEFEAAKPNRSRHHASGRPGKQAKAHRRSHHMGKRAGGGKRAKQMRSAIDAEMFDILDTDANGQLSRAEHAAGSQPRNRHLARQRAVFKRLDKDGDGSLTATEMPNPARRLSAADADGDGSVTREEMRAHRQAKHQNKAG